MLDHLKLNLPECDAIDLQSLNIDWQSFNLAVVKYYNKWRHVTKNVNIKTFSIKNSIQEQVMDIHTGYIFYEDSNDVFTRINEIFDQLPKVFKPLPPESEYNWFNSDIVDEYELIKNVIGKIEKHINLEFGHIKLRYVGPRDVETIHTDAGHYRYHIPIVTNDNVFFVSGDKLFHMRNTDKLYILNTTTPHTIVNAAGRQSRLHLIATNKAADYTFNNNDLAITAKKYVEHAEDLLAELTAADFELNNEVYKKTKIQILKIKKLNNL
jgi:Aspartyl/Asparaginyl beta-hydroxylase